MSKGQETKQSITQEAMAVASRLGLDNLSIGNLAKSVGMSKSGLFAHFASKESLQLHVLQEARERFTQQALLPALKSPRGEPRIRAIFKHWLKWENSEVLPGGYIFVSAATDYDDRPGAIRDFLVANQKDWFDFIARAAQIAVEEGHFRKDLDGQHFAYEAFGILLGYHQLHRLLKDPRASEHLNTALEDLLQRSH